MNLITRSIIGKLNNKRITKLKGTFVADEKKAVKDYARAIKESSGKERATYKHILPDEKEHLSELRKLK